MSYSASPHAAAVDAGAGAALGERSTTAAANPFCCTTSAVLAAVVEGRPADKRRHVLSATSQAR